MNKEFIPYEQALELKELGFKKDNDFGLLYKGDDIPSILYQQAFRWFREKHNLFSVIDVDQTMEPLFCYSLSKYKGNFQWDNILPTYSELYYTYEEAELACLKKLIEIVKNK
jgi:hypothetical protein